MLLLLVGYPLWLTFSRIVIDFLVVAVILAIIGLLIRKYPFFVASMVFTIGGYMMALELGGYKLDILEATLYTISLYLFLEVAYAHTFYPRFVILKGVIRNATLYIVGTSLLFFMLTLTIGFIAGGTSLFIFFEFSRLIAIISSVLIVALTVIFIARLLQKPPQKRSFFIF